MEALVNALPWAALALVLALGAVYVELVLRTRRANKPGSTWPAHIETTAALRWRKVRERDVAGDPETTDVLPRITNDTV